MSRYHDYISAKSKGRRRNKDGDECDGGDGGGGGGGGGDRRCLVMVWSGDGVRQFMEVVVEQWCASYSYGEQMRMI